MVKSPPEKGVLWWTGVVVAVGFVTGVVSYHNTLDFDWTYDDKVAVRANPDVVQSGSIWKAFEHDFWGNPIVGGDEFSWTHHSYRPLTVLSFRLDRELWGLEVSMFHLSSVLVYGLCCGIAGLFFSSFSRLWGVDSGWRWRALASSALFAAHPVHSEVVANVTGRAEVLSSLLVFAGLWVYSVQLRERMWMGMIVAGLCCVLGVLCKETALVAPALLFLIESAAGREDGGKGDRSRVSLWEDFLGLFGILKVDARRSGALRIRPIVALIGGGVVVYVVRFAALGAYSLRMNDMHNAIAALPNVWHRVLSAAYVQARSMGMLVVPWGLSYEHNQMPMLTSAWDIRCVWIVVFWAIVGSVVVWIFRCDHTDDTSVWSRARRWRILAACGITLVSFLPASHTLVRVGFTLAERQLFLPSAGVVLLIVEAFSWLSEIVARKEEEKTNILKEETAKKPNILKEKPNTLWVFSVRSLVWVWVALFVVGSIARSMVWRGEESLVLSCLRKYGRNNFMSLYGLGAVRMYRGQPLEAADVLRAANMISGDVAESRVALAQTLLRYTDSVSPMWRDEAMRELRWLVDNRQLRREYWQNYGILLRTHAVEASGESEDSHWTDTDRLPVESWRQRTYASVFLARSHSNSSSSLEDSSFPSPLPLLSSLSLNAPPGDGSCPEQRGAARSRRRRLAPWDPPTLYFGVRDENCEELLLEDRLHDEGDLKVGRARTGSKVGAPGMRHLSHGTCHSASRRRMQTRGIEALENMTTFSNSSTPSKHTPCPPISPPPRSERHALGALIGAFPTALIVPALEESKIAGGAPSSMYSTDIHERAAMVDGEADYWILAADQGSALPSTHPMRCMIRSNAACIRLTSPTDVFGNLRIANDLAIQSISLDYLERHIALYNRATLLLANGVPSEAVPLLQRAHELAIGHSRFPWTQSPGSDDHMIQKFATLQYPNSKLTQTVLSFAPERDGAHNAVGDIVVQRLHKIGASCALRYLPL